MRLLAACLLALSAPAAAQIAGKPPHFPAPRTDPFLGDSRLPGPGAGREARTIRRDVERRRERGEISRREARALKREARLVGLLSAHYRRDGLSEAERRELQARTHVLRDAANRAQTAPEPKQRKRRP